MSIVNGVLPVGLGTIVNSGSQQLWASNEPLAPGTVVYTGPVDEYTNFSSAQVGTQVQAVNFGALTVGGVGIPNGNYAVYSVLRNTNFSFLQSMGSIVNWSRQLQTQNNDGQLIGGGALVTNVGTGSLIGRVSVGVNPITGG